MNSNAMSSLDRYRLAERLSRNIEGDVLFDRFSRGRYSTDASFYQIEPLGVVLPKTELDLIAISDIAREEGAELVPRGGGSSQSGQTVGRGLVIDFSKYLKNLVSLDADAMRCTVQPGIVLDNLNRELAEHGLWYPIDVSTSSRATIGGMAGNNSCGTRSLRYGIMRDNVRSIDAILPNGLEVQFSEIAAGRTNGDYLSRVEILKNDLLELGSTESERIASAFPAVSRRVGGYNIDALVSDGHPVNLAELLIGSEGTLALFKRIELELSPVPQNKALGVCHFPTFRAAMEAAQHIVKLNPVAVELVDRNLIELARDIPLYSDTLSRFVKGEPDSLLLTEFAEDNQVENVKRLKQLDELMADLGHKGSVVEAVGTEIQNAIWEIRKSGLNIMMSMKSEGKPISFIEDCAVPLEHLADYTERLTQVFEKHGTRGTWYAHASVGCLHVRPVLNLKLEEDVKKMRAIAEEAFDFVKEYKGSHSGEHGDGLVRSEFHEKMYGRETIALFEQVKKRFDPNGRMNPGKIVYPERMDYRPNFRYRPGYHVAEIETSLDWSEYPGAGGGFQGAIEMCNNNGACRKFDAAVMCPSYRVTGNERDVTRGRANTLRLAISGQFGRDALTSDAMQETLKLCVSCKGCKRECPTGVDMAKMKIEVQHARAKQYGISLHERLVAYLPRYAPFVSKVSWLANSRNHIPGMSWVSDALAGFAKERPLPKWSARPFQQKSPIGKDGGSEVALFADTFNRYFEPENLWAACEVLEHAGYLVHMLQPAGGGRPLCCGRTFLAAGLVEEARAEAKRFEEAASSFVKMGIPIIGLEPSCLFTLKDEFKSLVPSSKAKNISAHTLSFEEFVVKEVRARRFYVNFGRLTVPVFVHGHCHQKAFNVMDIIEEALRLIPDTEIEMIQSSCCGMAGAFGYGSDTFDVSMAMGELSLFPAVREADPDAVIIADGFSCRHQIRDGSGRSACHTAILLKNALGNSRG